MPSAEASDALPVAPFAKNQIDRAFAIGNAVRGEASLRGIPMSDPDPIEFSLLLLDGSTIVCDVANVVESATEGLVYSISYHSKITKELIRQSVRLLALCAAGKLVQKAFVIQMKEKKDSFVLVNEIELSPEISADEALRRLFELSKAAHIARDLPCAKFDKTGQAIAEVGTINDDSVIDAFESFVDGFSYERSAEFVVYGADPVFEHVYADNSDKKIEVLTALVQGCNLEKDGKKKDSYQHWVVK